MNIDRIKEIQKDTAYPESLSVYLALIKVWNECAQNKKHKLSAEEMLIIAKVAAKLNRMDAHLSQHFTVNRNFHEEINECLQSLRTILHNNED